VRGNRADRRRHRAGLEADEPDQAADEMLAVCEPGVINNDLTAEAARHGHVPDPGSRQLSTIGGNVGGTPVAVA
jgi:FAD/FMN-containing dehydrogenase